MQRHDRHAYKRIIVRGPVMGMNEQTDGQPTFCPSSCIRFRCFCRWVSVL